MVVWGRQMASDLRKARDQMGYIALNSRTFKSLSIDLCTSLEHIELRQAWSLLSDDKRNLC